ncbi:hypothetical protein PISMIDRAFT_23231 [Pisolithus microcarpus 441]|uniref:DNA 3'-5' helicase n=1 Tax=Pisolithus microcarpus 441 TaxID=765257 RepID=A0A0C9ZWY6_9AGAM|nr:hypothetical protein PISMIDRAFT_23231 [Pisolithus microcarpus 441]
MPTFICYSCDESFSKKSAYITHRKKCSSKATIHLPHTSQTIVLERVEGKFMCHCTAKGCPKPYKYANSLRCHIQKAGSRWIGPGIKGDPTTMEQLNLVHDKESIPDMDAPATASGGDQEQQQGVEEAGPSRVRMDSSPRHGARPDSSRYNMDSATMQGMQAGPSQTRMDLDEENDADESSDCPAGSSTSEEVNPMVEQDENMHSPSPAGPPKNTTVITYHSSSMKPSLPLEDDVQMGSPRSEKSASPRQIQQPLPSLVNDDDFVPGLRDAVEAYYEESITLLDRTGELVLQRLNSPDPTKRQEYSGKHFTGSNNMLMELSAVLRIQDPEEGSRDALPLIHQILFQVWSTAWTHQGDGDIVDPTERASSLAYDTMSLPQVWWTDTKTWKTMLYRGEQVHFADLCKVFEGTEAKLLQIWEESILMGQDIRVDYDKIADDLVNKDVGYSFLSDTRNPQLAHRDGLLRRFLQDKHSFSHFAMIREGKIIWNRSTLQAWLRSYAELQSLLLLRAQMLSGAPSHGTELTAMTYRNTQTRPTRNLVVLGKHISLLCQYLKTTALTGKDKLIPHGLDGITSDILVQDLALARPFAEVAAKACFPDKPEVVDLYHNQVFVNYDQLFDSKDLSTIMTKYSLPILNFGLTINSWRHIQTAWKRKLGCAVEDIIEMDREDNVEALQAGHNRSTENRVYGISVEALAGAAEDILPAYLNASMTWQRHCKVPLSGQLTSYKKARSTPPLAPGMEQRGQPDKQPATYSAMSAEEIQRVANAVVEQLPSTEDIASRVLEKLIPALKGILQEAMPPSEKTRDKGKCKEISTQQDCLPGQGQCQGIGDQSLIPSHHLRQGGESRTGENQIILQFSHVLSTKINSQEESHTQKEVNNLEVEMPVLVRILIPYISWALKNRSLIPEPEGHQGISDQLLISDQAPEVTTAALQAMQTLLQDPNASWKSREQKACMVTVLGGSTDLIAVLGTGAGKSMLAIVPSIIQPNQATVLVLPLKSLLLDYKRRLEFWRVPYQIFSPDRPLNISANLILVTADRALTAPWRSALAMLNEQKKVARLIFDEAHIPLMTKSYRVALQNIHELRSISMQLVLLSATLPPWCMEEVKSSFQLLRQTKIVQHCTNRPELSYHLERVASESVQDRVLEVLEMESSLWTDRDRGLVFVTSIAAGHSLCQLTAYPFYNGDKGTTDAERQLAYQQWIGGMPKVLIATTAFSAGNDYPHVRTVIHMGKPFDMVDYIQGQGRAGRDGQPANCYTVIPLSSSKPDIQHAGLEGEASLAIYEFLYCYGPRRCLRYGITLFNDGQGISCHMQEGNQECSVCLTDPGHDPSGVHIVGMTRLKQKSRQLLEAVPRTTEQTTSSHATSFEMAAMQLEEGEKILGALQDFEGGCSLCSTLDKGSSGKKKHRIEECPNLAGNGWNDYIQWRKELRYQNHHKKICYMCHVPQINDVVHPQFVQAGRGTPCRFADLVAPTAYGVYLDAEWHRLASVHFDQSWEDERAFARWLMGRPREGHHSNLIDLFMWHHQWQRAKARRGDC